MPFIPQSFNSFWRLLITVAIGVGIFSQIISFSAKAFTLDIISTIDLEDDSEDDLEDDSEDDSELLNLKLLF